MSSSTLDDPLLHRARARAGAGAWREVTHLLESSCGSAAERPERLTLYAEALLRCGEPRRAHDCLRTAAPDLQRVANAGARRTALNLLGAASFALGALAEAQEAWDAALELAERAEDPLLVARATNNLGAIANLQGSAHDALRLYNLAVPLYQRLGELRGLAETYHNLAMTHRDMGHLTRADEYEQRAMTYAREGGVPRLEAMAQVGRAEVALLNGDHRLAAATGARAAAAARRLGDAATAADASRCAAEAHTALGEHEEARRLLATARENATRAGEALMQAEIDLAEAVLAERTGSPAVARRLAQAALDAFSRLGARRQHLAATALLDRLGPEMP